MIRRICVLGAAGLVASQPAWADDLVIGNAREESFTTATAANNSPGNISIIAGGSVSVSVSGPALTLNSDHAISNAGNIVNSGEDKAIGVLIEGGHTGSYNEAGIVNLSGLGSNNIAILVSGPGTFTGSITTGLGSIIVANGVSAIGIAVTSPVVGDINSSGTVSIAGQDAQGLLVTAPITGRILNGGSIAVAGARTLDNVAIDPQAGSALAIGASVSGGLFNSGPFSDSDVISTTGTISTIGSRPAVHISPSIASASASDVTIGVFTDLTNPGFSFINRGSVTSIGNDPGIDSTGIRIAGDGTHTATLTGGFYNRGTVSAASSSSNITATSVSAADANAFGFVVGGGGSLPDFLNDGTLQASVSGSRGGSATGLLIEAGGSLPSLTNNGALSGTASTTDTSVAGLSAYGIRDLSGSLTTITNAGSISAIATTLDSGAQITRALDLSATTSPIILTNTGNISGAVLFGSGANQMTVNGGVIAGDISTNGGTLTLDLSQGTLRTANVRATALTAGSTSKVEFVLSQMTPNAPLIATTGNATFATGVQLALAPNAFLPDNNTFTLISTGGTLSFGDFSGATSLALPFLYAGSYSRDTQNVYLTIQRKTAATLGLIGNAANIYEPLVLATAQDDSFGAALLTLDNGDSVRTAVDASLPNMSGGTRALAIAATDSASGPIGMRQRAVTSPGHYPGFVFWAQEFYTNIDSDSTSVGPGYFGSGLGISMGADWGDTINRRYGAGYTFFAGHTTEKKPRESKTNLSLHLFSLYTGWRIEDFFVTPQISGGLAEFSSKRTVVVGNQTRMTSASWSGYVASGSVTGGFVIDLGIFDLIPQISIDGLYLSEDAHTEGGGGNAVNLSLPSQEHKSLRAFMGVVAQGEYTLEDARLFPRVLAGWSHDFQSDAPTIDATFQAVPGSPFALVGPPAQDSRFVGGASLGYVMRNWSAGFNYDASAASGTLAQTASFSLTSRF